MDPALIVPAITGADAVISAVGPRGIGPTTVIQDSVRSIIQAMDKTSIRRLLQVTGSVVTDEGESPYLRCLLTPLARRTLLRHVCADMRRAEDQIRDSDLDWTILRPPALTGKQPPEPTAPQSIATCRTDSRSLAPTWLPACSPCSTTRRSSATTYLSPADTRQPQARAAAGHPRLSRP